VPHYPHQFLLGVAVLAVAIAVRAAARNRLIRSKLRLTLLLTAVYTAVNLAFAWLPPGGPGATAIERLGNAEQLLLALAVVNLLVVLLINPWRQDRVPDRFPNIVQDAIIIGVFGIVGTLVLGERIWTVSAVSGVVVGLALQDTLGNMFAGLGIQVEKPFRVGHWISVGGFEGKVSEITWRATKLRTKTGNVVVVPNNIVSKEAITNYSEPAAPTRIAVDVGVTYETPPAAMKEAMAEALGSVPRVLTDPPPDVILESFADSSIVYRVRFWIDEYGADDAIRNDVRTSIYYTLKRRGISIPFPILVQYNRREGRADLAAAEREAATARLLAETDLFAALTGEERAVMAASARELVYGAGQVVVRQGAAGDSMFVIRAGEARVTLGPDGREVAKLGAGSYVGEMSMLTGDPRSATVTAVTDCTVIEVTAEAFRRVAIAHPDIVERVSAAIEVRRAGLERTRQEAALQTNAGEAPRSLLARIQQFLGLRTAS